MLTPQEIEFITKQGATDTALLLLGASRYPGINVPLCVKCIEARKKLSGKIPQWYNHPGLVFPVPLSVEQSSSQATALYKQQLLKNDPDCLKTAGADLTGGMGVDSYYLSQTVQEFDYFERNPELCRAAGYNFKQLQAGNIQVTNLEITPENISSLRDAYGFIFIDPARRRKTDKTAKVISLQDYEPNLMELKERLLAITSTLLVKISPMADISLHLKLLPETTQVHIVSVDNECKELLFLLRKERAGALRFFAANIQTKQKQNQLTEAVQSAIEKAFVFLPAEEENATAIYTTSLSGYLYEPHKSILKSGAFKLVSERYGIQKLAPSTHLYTSEIFQPAFPGKIYRIEETMDFNKKNLKLLARKYPQADLSARNFPLDTNALKKQSGIRDGGTRHIFAVTLANGNTVLITTCR